MKKLLLVIDVQNDFINDNTREYVSKIQKLIDSNEYKNIAFTKFMNSKENILYKRLNYKGCMEEEGQRISLETKENKVFEKTGYSALNKELKEYIRDNFISEIYLCGFDTDACIQKTALDLFENGYDVYVLKDYCMSGKGKELHDVIINNLKRLIGSDKIV